MKNLSVLISFLFCAMLSYGQFNPVPRGNATQLDLYRGAVQGVKGFILPVQDTTANPATQYLGALTVLPTDVGLSEIPIWMSNGTYWIRFSGSSASNINDTIYTRLPIFVDTVSQPGKRIITLLHANGLLSGGVVVVDSCMKIAVSPAVYFLNYIQYTSAFTRGIVIAAADPSNPRKDVVILTLSGTDSVLTGTPAATPIAPQIDPSTQVYLTTIDVPAGATCLAVTQRIIYDQKTGTPEYTPTTSGTITANPDNTDNPYHLTKADFVSVYTSGATMIYTKTSGTDTVHAGQIFLGYIYLNQVLINQVQGQWFNGSTAVSNPIVLNPYLNANNTGTYQLMAVPMSAWNFANTSGYPQFNKLVLTFSGSDLSGAGGFYIDYIQLQTGITNVATTLQLTTNGSSGAATLINNVLNIPVYTGGGGGLDSSAYHTVTQVDDSTFTINDLLGRTDTIQIITGSGGGGGGDGIWTRNGNFIYPTNSGNIGLGTSSPASKLTVEYSIPFNVVSNDSTGIKLINSSDTVHAANFSSPPLSFETIQYHLVNALEYNAGIRIRAQGGSSSTFTSANLYIEGYDDSVTTPHLLASINSAGTYTVGSTTVGSGIINATNIFSTVERTGTFNASSIASFGAASYDTTNSTEVQINSTMRGFLLPRLRSGQRDSIEMVVTSITVTAPGSGYVVAPDVTLGHGTPFIVAVVTPAMSGGGIATIGVVRRGRYYGTPPVDITPQVGDPGTGATATANMAQDITVGTKIFCTDCTANDASTGVEQTYTVSGWKNSW